MADLTLASADGRRRIYKGLRRRNVFVWFLRFAVPIFGALVLVVLLAQIFIANFAAGFGIAGVTLDRDQLVINAPNFKGVMQNGDAYSVVADKATALLTNTDLIDLTNAVLRVRRQDGSNLIASAESAIYDVVSGTVEVLELMRVRDSRGTNANLTRTVVDWTAQTIVSKGRTRVVFSDNSVLTSAGLTYSGEGATWEFNRAQLITNRPKRATPRSGGQ